MKKSKAKRKLIRKINRKVRNTNQQLLKDVFGDRFHFTITERYIYSYDDNSGYYARIKVLFGDRESPERNIYHWYDEYELCDRNIFCGGESFDKDVNNFIVTSDFWKKYRNRI